MVTAQDRSILNLVISSEIYMNILATLSDNASVISGKTLFFMVLWAMVYHTPLIRILCIFHQLPDIPVDSYPIPRLVDMSGFTYHTLQPGATINFLCLGSVAFIT
ncbi:hypothetical protein BDW62DRAFT_98459 [Aspergillus aurantiobrunneus]